MSKWIFLILAIVAEVIGTLSLKSTEGFTKLWPSTIVIIGYCAAFYFLSLTLESIPISIVYAIWSGVGIAAIAVVSVLFLDQKLDLATMIGLSLIIAGVVVLRLYSEASVE
jgi:small multidrug resistance pump